MTIEDKTKKASDGRYCLASDQSICYEGNLYRSSITQLRDIRETVKDFPVDLREPILNLISRAVNQALNASQEIYLPLLDKSKLEKVLARPNDYQTDMNALIRIPTEIFGITRETGEG